MSRFGLKNRVQKMIPYGYFRNIDWRLFLPSAVIILSLIAVFLFNLESEVLVLIRDFIIIQQLRPVLFFTPVVVALAYYLADTPASEDSEEILFSGLGEFLNTVFTGTTYGFFISTSYLFLIRYYMQLFFDRSFFTGFASRDLGLIAIILGYVFYRSSMRVYNMASQAFFTGDVGEVVTDE